MFPEAKFVHIHRNPYHVFASTVHMKRKVIPWSALQRPNLGNLEEDTLHQYREVYDAFFHERGLIPNGHYCEPLPVSRAADANARSLRVNQWLDPEQEQSRVGEH